MLQVSLIVLFELLLVVVATWAADRWVRRAQRKRTRPSPPNWLRMRGEHRSRAPLASGRR